MFTMSYMGDHVWLMTSRQTLPDLRAQPVSIHTQIHSLVGLGI